MSWEKQIPEWVNKGTAPSEELRTTGFQGGYKPPASVFNWYWAMVIDAIAELQGNVITAEDVSEIAPTVITDTTDVATAFTTAYNAYTENKEVLLKYDSIVYRLVTCTDTVADFFAVDEGIIYYLSLNSTLNKISTSTKSTKVVRRTVTISSSGWAASGSVYTYTATVSGVVADETAQLISVMPATASRDAYMAAGVYASAQAANKLTFTCSQLPTANLTVYVVIQEV